MKLTSNNVSLTANKKMGEALVRQNSREAAFIRIEYLEELRDLINDYLEMEG